MLTVMLFFLYSFKIFMLSVLTTIRKNGTKTYLNLYIAVAVANLICVKAVECTE